MSFWSQIWFPEVITSIPESIKLCRIFSVIPNPDADVVWMHFPFVIKENAPFDRRDLQKFFELRGIQTRPPFSGNILRQPMIKGQKISTPDSYENADDMMKNGVLLGCHQGLTDEQFAHVSQVCRDFFNQF